MRRLLAIIALALLAASCGGQAPPSPPPPTPQLGIDVLWYRHSHDKSATIRSKAGRIVSYLTALGANALSISFPFYMSGRRASHVYPQSATPSPARPGHSR